MCGIERKVKYIVSDDASNMIKAFSLPRFEESATSDASMDSDNDTDNESDDDTILMVTPLQIHL